MNENRGLYQSCSETRRNETGGITWFKLDHWFVVLSWCSETSPEGNQVFILEIAIAYTYSTTEELRIEQFVFLGS